MIKIYCDICGKEIENLGSKAHSHSHYKVAITSRGRDGSKNSGPTEWGFVLNHVCHGCAKKAAEALNSLCELTAVVQSDLTPRCDPG